MKNYRLLALTAIVVLGIFSIIGTALAGSPFCDPKLLADPIKTDAGYVSGTMIGTLDQAVRIYRGIPYAAPPVGDLRWKAPQPVAHWSGIREATVYAKMPIQAVNVVETLYGMGASEDCLYLNVVTPARSSNDKLPVMVFFHGGGLMIGTSAEAGLNSYRLASNRVITVTPNHRLGVFGLLAHSLLTAESGTSGNYMVLDMIAALKWVQKNIRAFGGDPKNVTIFGQSGGGMKVSALIASPMATGLFSKAIIQSGAPFQTDGQPLATVEGYGEKLFTDLGVSTLADARALDYATIVAADNANAMAQPPAYGWSFAIDNSVLNGSPYNVIAAGQGNRVHLIAGVNAGELAQFPGMIPTYVQMFGGVRSQGMRTYGYEFNQTPANWVAMGGVAVHGMELEYVFGDYDNTISPADWWLMQLGEFQINPSFPPPATLLPLPFAVDIPPALTAVDKRVSENMMTMWTNFAKTGNPSIHHLVNWPVWSPSSDRYLYIADPLQVLSGFSTIAP